MKVPISVIVPVKNEAGNLPRCLRSVSWADEIFVVDSQSTDGTPAIAEAYGARVVQFVFNGVWPKKRNWALDNLPFKHEWVFILDADEVLPLSAKDELNEICKFNARGFNGYFVNRHFMFMGKWLKHAYYPNWILRCFKNKLARYRQCTDIPWNSGLYDNESHEPLELKGKAGYLESEIDHYAFPDVKTFVTKHNYYSTWESCVSVKNVYSDDYRGRAKLGKEVTGKYLLKRLVSHFPARPFLRFLYIYFIQMGFLDGWEGYYFARLHGFYEFLSVCKTYELREHSRHAVASL